MKPTKNKLPREAIELYNDFIHGEISRRAFMEGIQRLAGGLAAATVINALMPNYALGQQVSRTDDRIKTTYETVPSPKGNGSIKGYLARPISADTRSETTTKLPGIIVVHENRKRLSRSGLDHLGMPGGREGAASPPSRQSPR
jgi:carboxymethylenebutenolidase